LRDIPFDRLRPKDKPTRYFVDNEYVDGWYVAKQAFMWVVIGAAIVLGAIVIRTIIVGTVNSLQ
jgi:hypothetical protein